MGLTWVHLFDDPDVIAGQATVGLELVRQLPELGTVVVPVGGGGRAWLRTRSRPPARTHASSGSRRPVPRPSAGVPGCHGARHP